HRVVHALATADGEELEQRHVPRIDVAITMDLVQHSTRRPRKRKPVTNKGGDKDSRGPPAGYLGGYHYINRYV
ncbi:MAG: hypothetical protein HQL58_11755, partial [Magnetococcales bacterium]|nr:hypothetical protein [Magnetococcales bacterium]